MAEPKLCEHEDCRFIANYGLPKSNDPHFCGRHAEPGMVDLNIILCEEEGCMEQAFYNVKRSPTPRFCNDHKLGGMVDIRDPICRTADCMNDPTMNIPGVIEYTNLCQKPESILYIPYYMPQDHQDYQRANSWFYERSREYLKLIDNSLAEEDILAMSAGRYEYAQPICPPRFMEQLPPRNPGVENLLIADTSYYYPEDRSVSESIKLGRELALD